MKRDRKLSLFDEEKGLYPEILPYETGDNIVIIL